MIHVTIPGEPCAQGRPRATVVNGRAKLYDPKNSRSWKGTARMAMQATRPTPILDGAIAVELEVVHSCPRSEHRQRVPLPRRWRDKRPDIENVVKAILDAATGVLWRDDAQIAQLYVEQITGAQGEAPSVEMWAWRLPMEYAASEWTVGDAIKAISGTVESVEDVKVCR